MTMCIPGRGPGDASGPEVPAKHERSNNINHNYSVLHNLYDVNQTRSCRLTLTNSQKLMKRFQWLCPTVRFIFVL